MSEKVCVVVAWWNEEQILKFLEAWGVTGKCLPDQGLIDHPPEWLILQRDAKREGCAVTKNKGVAEAMRRGFDVVVVLDDDCFPPPSQLEGPSSLGALMQMHAKCLEPQPIEMLLPVTTPISRGTPYQERTVKLPVAASMGFWTEVGDYDAPSQLVYGAMHPMEFNRIRVVNNYFALCGMNLAFRPKDWLPWCTFIDVPRFDDIWMGWLWQREAYRRGYCFNLNGPLVRHSRQSNVWQNLRDEAKHLEWNETGWRQIATHTDGSYEGLRALLPV